MYIETSGMTWYEKKKYSVANRVLRIVEAHNRWMESWARKSFYQLNIESSIKMCHKTSLNWDLSWFNVWPSTYSDTTENSRKVKRWNASGRPRKRECFPCVFICWGRSLPSFLKFMVHLKCYLSCFTILLSTILWWDGLIQNAVFEEREQRRPEESTILKLCNQKYG